MVYQTTEDDSEQADVYSTLTEEQLKIPCANCKEFGHWARECPEPDHREETTDDKQTADLKREDKKQPGQTGGRRHWRKKPGKKGHSASAYHVDEDYDIFGYGYVSHCYGAMEHMSPTTVCIDSLANTSFVHNESLLTHVRAQVVAVSGVHGDGTITKVGNLPGFGRALVATNSKANGLALCELEKRYQVTYVQQQYIGVKVNENLTLMFIYDPVASCYACEFDEYILNLLKEHEARQSYSLISTVSSNEAGYSNREIERAQNARKMMRRMHYPSDGGLIRTVTKGTMLECEVTGQDIMLATKIYGKDVASLQGKTKDMGPTADTRMYVHPMEQKQQVVYSDVFYWREVPFVLFIIKPLRLRMVQWMPKCDLANMIAAVKTLCAKIEAKGYQVKEIVTDPAKQLAGLQGKLPYNLTTVGSRTHVADAEVEIRILKERLRSTERGLPFNLARRLIR